MCSAVTLAAAVPRLLGLLAGLLLPAALLLLAGLLTALLLLTGLLTALLLLTRLLLTGILRVLVHDGLRMAPPRETKIYSVRWFLDGQLRAVVVSVSLPNCPQRRTKQSRIEAARRDLLKKFSARPADGLV